MDRKIHVLVSMVTILSILSCSEREMADEESVPVSFSATVAAKSGDIQPVRTLDLLVFHADGSISTHETAHGNGLDAKVTAGPEMDWYLIANDSPGKLEGIYTEQALRSRLSMLSDSSPSAFVMAASGRQVFMPGDHIDAELSRLACRITLGSFSPQFLESSYPGADVRATGLFLINVVGSCPFSMSPREGDWLNRMGMDGSLSGNLMDFLRKDLDIPLDSGTVDGPWSLYCMPNPVDNGVHSGMAAEWSPRNTRLVLELSINGVKSWYPMDLPAMECNHEYVIENVRLLGEGSWHPDIPVSRKGLHFSVSVTPWETESKDIDF